MSSYPIDTKVPPFDPHFDIFFFFEILGCCIVQDTPRVQLTKAMAYKKPKFDLRFAPVPSYILRLPCGCAGPENGPGVISP